MNTGSCCTGGEVSTFAFLIGRHSMNSTSGELGVGGVVGEDGGVVRSMTSGLCWVAGVVSSLKAAVNMASRSSSEFTSVDGGEVEIDCGAGGAARLFGG
jgi:hypothetical protein